MPKLPEHFQQHCVETHRQLDEHYPQPAVSASLVKEIDHLSEHYQAFVERSPFAVLATVGPGGLDCSPRGDPPGFVSVLDSTTLALPDRRGNNRLDSLRNLVDDSRASLLFLIPGIGETLRINGDAYIVTDPELRQRFEMQGKLPASVIVFTVGRVYFQCQKALVRSGLWRQDTQVPRSDLPSTGEILQALAKDFDGEQYDRDYPDRLRKTIY